MFPNRGPIGSSGALLKEAPFVVGEVDIEVRFLAGRLQTFVGLHDEVGVTNSDWLRFSAGATRIFETWVVLKLEFRRTSRGAPAVLLLHSRAEDRTALARTATVFGRPATNRGRLADF